MVRGFRDVEVGERSVERARQPPGLAAEQGEHGGDKRHANHERVHEHADSHQHRIADWVRRRDQQQPLGLDQTPAPSPAPSPTRSRPSGRPGTQRPTRPRIPGALSSPPPARHVPPARRCAHRAHPPAADPRPRARCAGRAATLPGPLCPWCADDIATRRTDYEDFRARTTRCVIREPLLADTLRTPKPRSTHETAPSAHLPRDCRSDPAERGDARPVPGW